MKKKKWKLTQRVASNIIVVFAGVAFYLALSNFDAVRAQLAAWVRIIAPFIWGLALAYLLDGPVRFFEKKFHCRRGLSIALTCVLTVLSISLPLIKPLNTWFAWWHSASTRCALGRGNTANTTFFS